MRPYRFVSPPQIPHLWQTACIVVAAAFLASLAIPSAALVIGGPPDAHLESAIRDAITVWWEIGTLRDKARVNEGDAVEPQIKSRIQADVSSVAELFVAPADALRRDGSGALYCDR